MVPKRDTIRLGYLSDLRVND